MNPASKKPVLVESYDEIVTKKSFLLIDHPNINYLFIFYSFYVVKIDAIGLLRADRRNESHTRNQSCSKKR